MIKMNRILAGHQFVANFLDEPIELGMIYYMDDKQFVLRESFQDWLPEVDLKKLTSIGSKGSIKFAGSKEVTIGFGVGAGSAAGQTQVKLGFNRKRSVAGAIDGATVESLRYGPILAHLQHLWLAGGFNKKWKRYIFVHSVVTAASGTLVYSEEANNQVVLEHKLGTPVTKIVDLGSGQFEYKSSTKSTLEIIRTTPHKPLFRAFHLKPDWTPELLG